MSAPLSDQTGRWRWTLSAALVLALHAGGAAGLLVWHEPIAPATAADAILVDLAPLANATIDAPDDLAPGPVQQPTEAPPPVPEKTEQNVEQKTEPAPSPSPAVAALPPPEPVKPEPPSETVVAVLSAPPRQRTATQAEIDAWHDKLVALIERHKAYPPSAQARGERGVAQLGFSIDRQGKVIASRIVHSSGYPALDRETIATVRRAQPFPPPPADLPGATFEFTLPVEFAR